MIWLCRWVCDGVATSLTELRPTVPDRRHIAPNSVCIINIRHRFRRLAAAEYDCTLFTHCLVPNRRAVASSRETKRDQILLMFRLARRNLVYDRRQRFRFV